MKRRTQERVKAVQVRVQALRYRRQRQLSAALVLCSVICAAGLATVFRQVMRSATHITHVDGLTATVLLFDTAGGYVFVAVLAFAFGTALALAWRNHHLDS